MIFTTEEIQSAIAAIKRLRPVYADILDFYKQIFVLQKAAETDLKMPHFQISEEVCLAKQKQGEPLITLSEFVIDTDAAEGLFKQMCQIAKDTNPALENAGNAIIAVEKEGLNFQSLFSALLRQDEAFFENLANELGIEKQILALFTYSSITPWIMACEARLAMYLDNDVIWGKGYCPICGSMPLLSVFGEQGERSLYCGFCWHQWAVQRIFCPFCENTDTSQLYYFYTEEEEGYRADVCEKCQKYIKTIDTRKLGHMIYPPAEQVSTLHLDMMANEKGLKSGAIHRL